MEVPLTVTYQNWNYVTVPRLLNYSNMMLEPFNNSNLRFMKKILVQLRSLDFVTMPKQHRDCKTETDFGQSIFFFF